jgi:hypothetical protein
VTFDELYDSLPADGWLSRAEAALLWEVARTADGPVLEVGCYRGRSTCLLAASGRQVFTVDPFNGFSTEDVDGTKAFRAFMANLRARGIQPVIAGGEPLLPDGPPLDQLVILFPHRIEDWDPLLLKPRPAGLAYLDGDHTYAGTLAQIKAALEVRAKVIAAHDVNDTGGGAEVKRALVEALGPWDERAERLAVWRRGP